MASAHRAMGGGSARSVRGRRWARLGTVLLGFALGDATPLSAQDLPEEQPPEEQPPIELAPEGIVAPEVPTGPPTWQWRQVLSTPRIGGRMTAVTVDPRDPDKIFVGTEESTVIRSIDGGITWREIELTPFLIEDRAIDLIAPGLPALGSLTPNSLSFFLDPPFSRWTDRVLLRVPMLVQYDTLPVGVSVAFRPITGGVPQDLLDLATRSRRFETIPVRRIAVCPGTAFPLLVATKYDLYGSMDDGLTYVRLWGYPGNVEINHVVCSKDDPRDVVLATGFGLFRSRDGGLTFEQVLVGWPGASATAVTFGPSENGHTTLYAAWGSSLFGGDPDSDEGLAFLYPDFNNSATAPWTDIWWIEVSASGAVWMATDDGMRVSLDGGVSWRVPDRALLERQWWGQVTDGANERGTERVAVRTADWIYATDDGGATWYPFFHGLTRRGFRQMAASPPTEGQPGRWWVITSGELWSNVPADDPDQGPADARVRRWALSRIRRTPRLDEVIDSVLEHTRLSPPAVNDATARIARRNLLPRIDVQFNLWHARFTRAEDTTFSVALRNDESWSRTNWEVYVQAIWYLKDVPLVSEEYSNIQNQLHELRRQVGFIVEDAWHERMFLLRRIGRGETGPGQTEILLTRIEALEAVMDLWTEEPFFEGTRPSRNTGG